MSDPSTSPLLERAERMATPARTTSPPTIDGKKVLPPQTRQTIGFGLGVFNLRHNPDHVVHLVREAVAGKADASSVGISSDELTILQNLLACPADGQPVELAASPEVPTK